MKVLYENRFEKDLQRIGDKKILARIKETILAVKEAPSLQSIPDTKKLKGETGYYRIRIGNYRIGIEWTNDTTIFVRALHRKEIYRYFP